MTRDPDITGEVLAVLARRRRRAAQRCRAFARHWLRQDFYPAPRAKAEWTAYCLLRNTWSRAQVEEFVAAYATDDMVFPGILDKPGEIGLGEFMACVGILAEGVYARTLPRTEMLTILAGADAVRGATIVEAARRGGTITAAKRSTELRDRNVAMAREYQEYLMRHAAAKGQRSPTAIKEAIGKRHDLSRSQAVAAIDQGLQILSGLPAP